MKKVFSLNSFAFAIAMLALVIAIPATSMADTFTIKPPATIEAKIIREGGLNWAVISWKGFKPDKLIHYKTTPFMDDEWKGTFDVKGKTSVKICLAKGQTFTFKKGGKWVHISQVGFKNRHYEVKRIGVKIDCSNAKGCKFIVP